MVIIGIMGGLGNQMFQCAFALSFLKRGRKVKLCTSYYNYELCHNGLELYNLFEIGLDSIEIQTIVDISEERGIVYVNESESSLKFKYASSLLTLDNAYLVGYWQNFKYFQNNRRQLLKLFSFRPISLSDERNTSCLSRINCSESVAIHIRRGDYVNSDYHRVLRADYYKRAINYLCLALKNPKFFIFSDDADWILKNPIHADAVHINWNIGANSYIDMHLMSRCKHQIIANSTFSWWAAWLNRYRKKIVIAPRYWHIGNENIGNSILPPTWVVL